MVWFLFSCQHFQLVFFNMCRHIEYAFIYWFKETVFQAHTHTHTAINFFFYHIRGTNSFLIPVMYKMWMCNLKTSYKIEHCTLRCWIILVKIKLLLIYFLAINGINIGFTSYLPPILCLITGKIFFMILLYFLCIWW